MAPSSMKMEAFWGWFACDTKETMLPLIFSIFAVAPIYNHGLPNIYGIDKMINTVFIYLFTY